MLRQASRRLKHLSSCISRRNIYATCSKMSDVPLSKDIKIPVPFGHLAGKVWNEGGVPVLGLHGWMDNAGTWDGVASLLPKDISLVAIDFPGHGLSSKRAMGTAGHYIDMVVLVERVVQHFGWKEVNLLGHSMGGGVAMLYAGTFPEKVKALMMVDMIKPLSVEAEAQPDRTAKGIKELLEFEEKLVRDPPCYDYDVMVDKMVKSYGYSLTEESAKTLLKRGSTEHPNGQFSFTYDPRIKAGTVLSMTFDQQKEFAKNLKCELLIIKASTGPLYENRTLYDQMLTIYEQSCKKFKYEKVEGTHHVHMNQPEKVTPIICDFMKGC